MFRVMVVNAAMVDLRASVLGLRSEAFSQADGWMDG